MPARPKGKGLSVPFRACLHAAWLDARRATPCYMGIRADRADVAVANFHGGLPNACTTELIKWDPLMRRGPLATHELGQCTATPAYAGCIRSPAALRMPCLASAWLCRSTALPARRAHTHSVEAVPSVPAFRCNPHHPACHLHHCPAPASPRAAANTPPHTRADTLQEAQPV